MDMDRVRFEKVRTSQLLGGGIKGGEGLGLAKSQGSAPGRRRTKLEDSESIKPQGRQPPEERRRRAWPARRVSDAWVQTDW
jgi:hypothetical protein